MEKLVIYRRLWARGVSKNNKLRDESGRMCCLGFDCLRRGIDKEHLVDRNMPADVMNYMTVQDFMNRKFNVIQKFDSRLASLINVNKVIPHLNGGSDHWINSDYAHELVKINDDTLMTENEREERLTQKFAAINVEVSFTDKAPPAYFLPDINPNTDITNNL